MCVQCKRIVNSSGVRCLRPFLISSTGVSSALGNVGVGFSLLVSTQVLLLLLLKSVATQRNHSAVEEADLQAGAEKKNWLSQCSREWQRDKWREWKSAGM